MDLRTICVFYNPLNLVQPNLFFSLSFFLIFLFFRVLLFSFFFPFLNDFSSELFFSFFSLFLLFYFFMLLFFLLFNFFSFFHPFFFLFLFPFFSSFFSYTFFVYWNQLDKLAKQVNSSQINNSRQYLRCRSS